jgi:hypothetical protein
MVAFALRADGWFLRSEIIWAKRNCMPESVGDRPTRAHEHLFLLPSRRATTTTPTRSASPTWARPRAPGPRRAAVARAVRRDPPGAPRATHARRARRARPQQAQRLDRRHEPYAGAHFATFPPKLIEPCILAGAREGDTVLDPFAGAARRASSRCATAGRSSGSSSTRVRRARARRRSSTTRRCFGAVLIMRAWSKAEGHRDSSTTASHGREG